MLNSNSLQMYHLFRNKKCYIKTVKKKKVYIYRFLCSKNDAQIVSSQVQIKSRSLRLLVLISHILG